MNNTIRSRRRWLMATAVSLPLLCGIPHGYAVEALLVQNAYVDSSKSNSAKLDSNGSLRVTKSGNQTCRTFLQFDVGTLPTGTTSTNIVEAWLRVWVNSSTTVGGLVTMTPVTSTWNESTITYSNIATMAFGSPQISNLSIRSTPGFIAVDVTPLVRAWVSGTLANQGVVIDTATGVTNLNLYFDCKESTTTSHEPQLEITIASVGPQGPAGPPGASGANGAQGPVGPAGATGPQGPVGATGEQGPAGAAGQTGAQGPNGPAGPIGLSWKGNWTGSTSYVPNDAVSFGGNAFVALQPNTNATPASGAIWDLLVQKGDAGATGAAGVAGLQGGPGPQGPIGPQGLPGTNGADGAAGPAGPAGPAGAQGPTGPTGPAPTRINPQGDLSMGEFTQGMTP